MKHSDVYKTPRAHEVGLPRPGDIAELRRSHCGANADAGLLVQVQGKPHLCSANCFRCGVKTVEYMVEVTSDHPEWQNTPQPWLVPISWLKRLDPRDPVDFVKIRNYRPRLATVEQLAIANR